MALDEPSDEDRPTQRVSFDPFMGLAPRRYMALFAMVERKDDQGNVIKWDPETAALRISAESSVASMSKIHAAMARFEKHVESH